MYLGGAYMLAFGLSVMYLHYYKMNYLVDLLAPYVNGLFESAFGIATLMIIVVFIFALFVVPPFLPLFVVINRYGPHCPSCKCSLSRMKDHVLITGKCAKCNCEIISEHSASADGAAFAAPLR
jgi:hypothetical protein